MGALGEGTILIAVTPVSIKHCDLIPQRIQHQCNNNFSLGYMPTAYPSL